jgi:hypothetical protein
VAVIPVEDIVIRAINIAVAPTLVFIVVERSQPAVRS